MKTQSLKMFKPEHLETSKVFVIISDYQSKVQTSKRAIFKYECHSITKMLVKILEKCDLKKIFFYHVHASYSDYRCFANPEIMRQGQHFLLQLKSFDEQQIGYRSVFLLQSKA